MTQTWSHLKIVFEDTRRTLKQQHLELLIRLVLVSDCHKTKLEKIVSDRNIVAFTYNI